MRQINVSPNIAVLLRRWFDDGARLCFESPKGVGQSIAERFPSARTIGADGTDDPHRPSAANRLGPAGGPHEAAVMRKLFNPLDGFDVIHAMSSSIRSSRSSRSSRPLGSYSAMRASSLFRSS